MPLSPPFPNCPHKDPDLSPPSRRDGAQWAKRVMLLGPFHSFLAQCDQMVDRSCDLHLKASIFGRLQSNDHRTNGQTAAASPVRDAIVQSRPSSGYTLSSHREHVALRQDATVFLILFHLFIFVFEKVSEWRIWGKFTCSVNETGQG